MVINHLTGKILIGAITAVAGFFAYHAFRDPAEDESSAATVKPSTSPKLEKANHNTQTIGNRRVVAAKPKRRFPKIKKPEKRSPQQLDDESDYCCGCTSSFGSLKREYLSKTEAGRDGKKWGKEVYRCPINPRVYHLRS